MNANEMYNETRKIIDRAIEILKQKLESMDIEQKKDIDNYGYAGNCGHILELVGEINQFMKQY